MHTKMTNTLLFKPQHLTARLIVTSLLVLGLGACGGNSKPPDMVTPATPTAVQLVQPPPAGVAPASAVASSAEAPTVVTSSPPASAAPPPAVVASSVPAVVVPTVSVRSMIEALEKSGAAPALDRSSDVKGPDVNANGVRDDIEAYINALPLTPKQIKAALQDAKANQLALTVDISDKAALQQVGDISMAAGNCLGDVLIDFYALSRKIEAMTANTRERTKRYLAYNAARSGSSTSMPNGDTCEK